ncbi:unnamed protein product [Caenorhabditis brenneri]
MADNRFPLFRIPFVALRIILCLFSPPDTIHLSLCSKRSLRVAKQCWKRKGAVKAELSIEKFTNIHIYSMRLGFSFHIVILQAKDLQDQNTHNIRVGDAVVPSIRKDIENVTFWDDKLFGIGQFTPISFLSIGRTEDTLVSKMYLFGLTPSIKRPSLRESKLSHIHEDCADITKVETLRMTDNRIPLFRIPFLALCQILDFYSLNEIIQLSLCSKRSLRVAKKCWKKEGLFWASLVTGIYPRIHLLMSSLSPDTTSGYNFPIYSTKDLRDRKVHNIRICDAVVPSTDGRTETITYWDDKVFGIEQTVRYIRDLFGVPINSVELRKQENLIRLMDTIMSMQDSVKNCVFNYINPLDDCLRHFLDNFKITGHLSLFGGPTRLFRHNWNIHLEDLYIPNGLSLTVQNLMSIDCQTLRLFVSRLTNQELNQFLKHWQNGGNSRIRYASIVINSLNQETIISGIDTVSQPRELRRYYCINNREITKTGGLDIQRIDGTTGTIFTDHDTFEFAVDPEMFLM